MRLTHYEILGVSKTATPEEIKRSYRQLARETHPDVKGTEVDPDRFRRVQEAYNIVGDTQKRLVYDQAQERLARRRGAPVAPPVVADGAPFVEDQEVYVVPEETIPNEPKTEDGLVDVAEMARKAQEDEMARRRARETDIQASARQAEQKALREKAVNDLRNRQMHQSPRAYWDYFRWNLPYEKIEQLILFDRYLLYGYIAVASTLEILVGVFALVNPAGGPTNWGWTAFVFFFYLCVAALCLYAIQSIFRMFLSEHRRRKYEPQKIWTTTKPL